MDFNNYFGNLGKGDTFVLSGFSYLVMRAERSGSVARLSNGQLRVTIVRYHGKSMTQRVYITGSRGFAGKALRLILKKSGYSVMGGGVTFSMGGIAARRHGSKYEFRSIIGQVSALKPLGSLGLSISHI